MENPYSKGLKNESTDRLIYIFFMANDIYAKDYIDAIKEEIIERGYDPNKFDEKLYIKYILEDFHTGWETEISNMFNELISAGWTKEQRLYYKNSWGRFTLEGFQSKVDEQLYKIIEKYKVIFETTCGECGNKDHVEDFYDIPLCQKCTINILEKRVIKNISDIGFKYYNVGVYENEISKYEIVHWKDIVQVEIENTYSETGKIEITLKKLTKKEEENWDFDTMGFSLGNITFSSTYNFNFFQLLKFLPNDKLEKAQRNEINKILRFNKCAVCERYAVLEYQCLMCSTWIPELEIKEDIERHGTIKNLINHKKQQLEDRKGNLLELRYRFENDKSFD